MALDSDPQDLKQNFGIPPLGRSTVMASRGTALGSLRPIFMQFLPLYVLNHNLKLRFKAENVGQMDLWLLKNKSDPN